METTAMPPKATDTTTDRRIRIYPLDAGYIPGVPHVQMLLEPELAEQFLAYRPAVFSRERPDGVELEEHPRETLDDVHLPWVPVDTSPAPAGAEPAAPVAPTSEPGE